MANDIDKTSPHYKGEFGSIYEVNQKFPSGGVEGDYVAIDGWAHYWNADRGTWCVNAQRDSYWDELITNIIEHFKTIKGATYMGVATTDTVPDTTAAKMFYFALQGGKYANFGNQDVAQGINVLLTEDGKSWTVQSLISVAQELGASTTMLVSQKAITDAINRKANTADVGEALAKKADKETVDTALGKKADKETVDVELGKKANKADMDIELGKKADKAAMDIELGKKFDKENIAQEFGDSEDKVVSQFALPFREIESPEFIKVIVDAENHFLLGIQLDGSIEWGKGIPTPIRAKLQDIINQCQQDKTEILDAINAAKEELAACITTLQKNKVDKEKGKSLIDDEVKKCFMVIENEEFIMAVIDSENRVLYGIYRDTGKPYHPQNDMYHISQSEEFLWVILDAANHPLLGIQQDGTCWAAKAKWLDDIKAIKEALSSIDETLKSFQPKEDGKGLINIEIADSFFYISNDEYIIAVVDAEDRILVGIKYDGEPYFPNHEMYSVITNEEWLYVIIDAENKVIGGFRADDGHMVVGGIDISTFIANAIIDIADIKERTAHLSTIENDEYLSVETDTDGKVIGYIAPDGSHYLYNVKSETIPEEFSSIEDPEGRVEIIKDKENRIIGFVDSQGDFHANTNVFSKNIDNLQNVSDNFCLSSHHEDVDIVLEEPRIAEVRLYAKRFPSSKTSDIKGKMKFISGKTFFERNVLINLQGSTSMTMPKKNISLDIMDSSYSDSLKVRFGDWVSQDSFHLKAYYFDLTKGVAPTAYMLYKQIEESNGFENDRPYKMYKKTILEGGADINDIEDSFNYDALCHPMGFPCVLYWNDEFYGLMSWQLKKHRDNYAMNKKNAKHIHLDGWIDKGTLFGGKVDWTAFEIRNPKSLVCSDGSSYDGENPKELIDDTMPNYDSSNKNHKNTMAVKKSIIAFSKYMSEIDAVIASSPEDTTTIKNAIEERFDVVRFMDYLLFIWATANTDSTAKNWQFLSYDGKKLTVEPYDLDSCWGIGAAMTGNFLSDKGKKYLFGTTDNPLQYIYRYYLTELKERWKVLRDKKIIDAENINNLYLGWYHRVGFDNIQKELKRWNESPCYRPIGLNESWELTGDSYVRFSTISTDWMPQNTYAENDKCKYNNRLYRSKTSGNINHIPTETEYWEDLTFVEGKTYHPNETCFWGYTSFFECKCKTETTSQPFKLYSLYPQELSNGFDSLVRLYRYAKNTINYIDSQLDYNL